MPSPLSGVSVESVVDLLNRVLKMQCGVTLVLRRETLECVCREIYTLDPFSHNYIHQLSSHVHRAFNTASYSILLTKVIESHACAKIFNGFGHHMQLDLTSKFVELQSHCHVISLMCFIHCVLHACCVFLTMGLSHSYIHSGLPHPQCSTSFFYLVIHWLVYSSYCCAVLHFRLHFNYHPLHSYLQTKHYKLAHIHHWPTNCFTRTWIHGDTWRRPLPPLIWLALNNNNISWHALVSTSKQLDYHNPGNYCQTPGILNWLFRHDTIYQARETSGKYNRQMRCCILLRSLNKHIQVIQASWENIHHLPSPRCMLHFRTITEPLRINYAHLVCLKSQWWCETPTATLLGLSINIYSDSKQKI